MQKVQDALFAPVDISFLVFYRFLIGAAVLWTVYGFFESNLGAVYAATPFHLTYHGFEWVKPLSASGMNVLFGILAVLAISVAAGFLYRVSSILLFLGFTYVFLIEKADYLNHYYLICLLLFLAVFLPANRCCSVDTRLRPQTRTDWAPAWTLWLLRFQIGLPYIYGGIAKLNPDWLRGQPMQIWLSIGPMRYLVGPVAEEHWVALLFSWGGALFDLAIVPLLLWKRTRVYAFAFAIVFHLLNAVMFDIGVFPWMMIGATLIFFSPDWPRRLLGRRSSPKPPKKLSVTPARRKLIFAALAVYVGFHLLVPFRHWLIPGDAHWTEEGHYFSWRMMLRTKKSAVQFVVTDRDTGSRLPIEFTEWITRRQFNKMAKHPEMIREFAHFLRQECEKKWGLDVEVRVVAVCSLNGRKPQQLIDPDVDLSREPRTLGHQSWILPLHEPFRWERWNIPVPQWPQHVRIRWPATR